MRYSDPMSSRRISREELSRWAVQRERFQLPDLRPPAPYRVTTPEHLLPNVMKKLGLEQPMWEQALLREWATLVGPQVAQHTRPGRLERGTLTVFVANSAWLSELRRYGEKTMLEKLQSRFGRKRIKGIRMNLDPDGPTQKR